MSEQNTAPNIYKDFYELQAVFGQSQQTIQNIYASLHQLVSPHGVQLSLQEVIDLTVEKLGRFNSQEVAVEDVAVHEEVAEEECAECEILPDAKKSRKSK